MIFRLRKRLIWLIKILASIADSTRKQSLAARRTAFEDLRKKEHLADPHALSGFGYKIFSQSDEDGIICEIFRRIGVANRFFIEFGVGDGLENNTASLLFDGWSGLWIEGSKRYCNEIRNGLSGLINSSRLTLINEFIYRENINELILKYTKNNEVDLLSVDIDGNDAHVIREIKCVNPRVIVLEYNAKFGPSIDFCMKYEPNYAWKKSDNFGASLKHFENLMRNRGYSLVGCNLVGTNAFFVRNDLVGEHFAAPHTSEHHFQPARYDLVGLPSGHPPTYAAFDSLG